MGTPTWKRANLPTCTITMLEVLKRLRDGHQAGAPFQYLDVDPRTIRALTRRDWIVASIAPKQLDEPRYAITGRGLKACEIYEIPPKEYDERRWDGICCRCGERERGWYSSGRRMPYCKVCQQEKDARVRRLFHGYKKPGLCPDCGVRQKYITASGRVRSYCLECRRKRSKAERQEANKRAYERVMAGEVLLCYRCHERPRQITGRTVQDYCRECMLEYQRERRQA